MNCDGSIERTTRQRYICSTCQSHKERCTGPSGYSVNMLEEAELENISQTLCDMQTVTYVKAYLDRVSVASDDVNLQQTSSLHKIKSLEADLADLNSQVIKSLHNESELSITGLQSAIEHTESKLKTEKQHLRKPEDAVSDVQHKKKVLLNAIDKSDELLAILHSGDSTAVTKHLNLLVKRIDVFQTF